MKFLQQPQLASKRPLDQSDDSIVYLVNEHTPLHMRSTRFALPGKLILQVLTPMLARFSLAEIINATNWYIYRTNQLSSLGERSIEVPELGPVAFCVESICSDTMNELPILVSPYVPGPQLEQLLNPDPLPLTALAYLSGAEMLAIEKFIYRKGTALGPQLRFAMQMVSDALRATSEIVHLDQVNIKFRWDAEKDIPMFVVTDIQRQIGQDIIF